MLNLPDLMILCSWAVVFLLLHAIYAVVCTLNLGDTDTINKFLYGDWLNDEFDDGLTSMIGLVGMGVFMAGSNI